MKTNHHFHSFFCNIDSYLSKKSKAAEILIIHCFDIEERSWVTADRTFNRSFYRFNRVSAVGADPVLLFTSLEQPFVFYIGKQKLVAGFMGLFNFADLGEKECNLREAFFFSGFSKFRIHGGPFIVFAFGSHLQMFSGRFFQISDKPELDLGMCSFIIGCFSE